MTMPKLKNPVAAVVLLALSASTALRFHSWLRDASMETTTTLSQYPPDFNRRLSHEPPPVTSDPLYDYFYALQLKRGHEPGKGAFDRVLGRKVKRRRRMLEQKRMKEDRRGVMQNLRDKKEVWIRGEFMREGGKNKMSNEWHRGDQVEEAKALAEAADALKEKQNLDADYEPLTVCDRPADVGSTEDFASLQKYSQCPEITPDKPILILEGMQSFGRTGNNIIEFLHAIQESRDRDIQLGVMKYSWATELLLKMWMAIESPDWVSEFERAFCVKMFHAPADLVGWNVTHQTTKELFYYQSGIRLGEYMDSQEYQIRTLFRNYNTGEEEGQERSAHRWVNRGAAGKDMCSGINSIFDEEDRRSAIYSVIHSRSLEGGPGFRLLGHNSRKSGCDPVAALEMRPDYVKSILEPLGMMDYPIVLITDGQNPEVLERLAADPEIGPLIRTVPKEACWVGGDLTMAVMSNVFIGNPASSFTGFIAKARLALGFGHNYLFRAKDENGEWKTVCGDHCIFDKSIMGVQA